MVDAVSQGLLDAPLVRTTGSVDEALGWVRRAPAPLFVVSDLRVAASRDGLELLRAAREMRKAASLVLLAPPGPPGVDHPEMDATVLQACIDADIAIAATPMVEDDAAPLQSVAAFRVADFPGQSAS